MGTRASFFIGNPEDTEGRCWLGCVAFDGYPDGDIGELLLGNNSSQSFRDAVEQIAAKRDDFCDPKEHGFPFPWGNDLFLTDYTYAFFNDAIQVTCFHRGWRTLEWHLTASEAERDAWDNEGDVLPDDVRAPAQYDSSGPDSIMIVRA